MHRAVEYSFLWFDTRSKASLELKLLRLLPGEALVGTEVSVLGSLEVDGLVQVELTDDDTRSEVEVLADDLDELLRGLLRGAVRVDVDGEGLSDTNGVGELDKGTSAKASVDQGLGDPSTNVGSRSIDLGEILTGESTTTVGTPATVGVDDDLSAGQTSITLGTTDDEKARGLDVVDGLIAEVLGGDDLLDDLLLDLLSELLGGDVGRVLSRDNDGVDTLRDNGTVVVLVLDGDLGLGVGSEPGEGAVTASSGHGSVELVSEEESKGEELRGLVSGITEHDTLVTSTELLKSLLVVETLSNVRGLLLNGDKQVAGLVVKTLLGVIVTDVLDGITDNLLVVKLGLGGDLTEDHDHTGLGGSLTSNLGEGVLAKAGIEDGVGNLISDLVGVTLTNGLGGEEERTLVVVLPRGRVGVDAVGTVGSHCENWGERRK
jgi:hypothetical protein